MRQILAQFVTADDRQQRRHCRSLVFGKEYENNEYIKCVRIQRFLRTPKARERLILNDFEVTTPTLPERAKPCPLYEEYGSEHFLLVQFQKSCRQIVVEKVVKSGLWVEVEGKAARTHYKFFGHSPTQLRNRHCVFYSSNLERQYGSYEEIIARFGTFSMKNVSKRASRIGLLLSTGVRAVLIDDAQVDRIDDIECGEFNFTDGCGLISPDIAEKITVYPMKHQYENQRYPFPSVYQIRFKGCKGTLMLDKTLNDEIKLRNSMIKFDWNPEKTQNWLRIVEDGMAVSFPNSYSCLNEQYTRLLSALGVPDDVFLGKLDTYFEELSRILHDQEVQVRYLCAHKRFDLAENILATSTVDDDTWKVLKHYQMTCHMQKPRTSQSTRSFDNQTEVDKIKLKLPLDQARLVFGVADISSQLEYGCCYFQPTIRGKPTVLEEVRVVVARSPSYHVGDIRVLKCVNIAECSHLVDCLVFPVNGQ